MRRVPRSEFPIEVGSKLAPADVSQLVLEGWQTSQFTLEGDEVTQHTCLFSISGAVPFPRHFLRHDPDGLYTVLAPSYTLKESAMYARYNRCTCAVDIPEDTALALVDVDFEFPDEEREIRCIWALHKCRRCGHVAIFQRIFHTRNLESRQDVFFTGAETAKSHMKASPAEHNVADFLHLRWEDYKDWERDLAGPATGTLSPGMLARIRINNPLGIWF